MVALAILGTLVFGLSVLRFRRDLAPAGSGARRKIEPQGTAEAKGTEGAA
jgi:hypothetical protein